MRQARAFFEALIVGNLDLGRPWHVAILFKRSSRSRSQPPTPNLPYVQTAKAELPAHEQMTLDSGAAE